MGGSPQITARAEQPVSAELAPWERSYAPAEAAAPEAAASQAEAPAEQAPWERTYAAPPEPSPIEKAGKAFYEGSGLSALVELASGDDERVRRVLTGAAQGIAAEPGRVWGEIKNLGQALVDPTKSTADVAYHMAGAVPLLGAPVQQVAQDIQRGDPASAVGHAAGLVAPMVAGPAAEAAGRAAATTGTLARGAVSGAVRAVPTAAKAALEKSIYGALGGPGGMVAAAKIAAAKELGQGAIAGARSALAQRAAAAAERLAAENAAAAAARETADAALTRQAQVYEAGEAMTQPPAQAQLPPASSYQMPRAGTAAEEARIESLQPEIVPPEATPPPAPTAAPAVTLEELAPALTGGKSLSKLNQAERAQVQSVYDRIQNPLPVEQPTPAERAIITPPEQATATLTYNAPTPTPESVFMEGQPAAARTPESLRYAQQLRDMMEGKPTPEQAARTRKVDTLSEFLIRNKIPLSMVDEFGDAEWKLVAGQAKTNIPSAESIQAIRARLAESELPADVARMPPAQAEAAFQKTRKTPRRTPPER